MGSEQLYHAQLFEQSLIPTIMAHQLTPPPTTIDPSSTTIKSEDLSMAYSMRSSSPYPTSHPTPSASSEGPKAAKKRKSWGQVLPEPKTNLPPRKRAKTEDEKEQRRIERVKRNRLAAHNSRERKRQEVELLQAEKNTLEDELKAAHQKMAQMAAQLKAFQKRHPGESPEITFDTPSSSDYESVMGQSDTICPRQTSFPSPVSMDSMDSPREDSLQPETPAYSESNVTELDQTRYPAVSVELAASLASSDSSFSFSLQPHTTFNDEKPLDDLFSFDQFPDNSLEQSASLVDTSDFFASSVFSEAHSSNPYGLSDHFDARHFDLQTASGATYVSDEALAAEV